MKKILLYTDTPQIGGAENQIFLLAKFLNKEKFLPILACASYSQLDKWCEKFQKEEIPVHRIHVKHKHDPMNYIKLKKILKTEKPDILHIHAWNPASCRYAFWAGSSLKIPIITTEHDPFKLSFIKNMFKKQTLKKIDKVITVSKQNKQALNNLYPEHKKKIEVIHNGIDITWWRSQILRFTEKDKINTKEKIFFANANTLIIISIAELHERKGLKYLIQSLPRLSEKFPNIKLVIVGEGPEKQCLQNLIKKLNLSRHVVLTGKQKEIPKLLKSSDIFVLPSKREAFGLVNLEAMITPLPVIATKVGGIPEIIEDQKTGILIEPENPPIIANALEDLINDPQKRQILAENGQKRVQEHFSAEKMAQKYESIYEEVKK